MDPHASHPKQTDEQRERKSVVEIFSLLKMAAVASLTPPSVSAKCSIKRGAEAPSHRNHSLLLPRRREILRGLAIAPLTLLKTPLPSEAREVDVGSYLPPAPSDSSFVFFKASPRDTPALRAGIVTFYSVLLFVYGIIISEGL